MADFKTILQLNQDADYRDQPYYDTMKGQLITLIDTACTSDTEYKVIYDTSVVLGALPGLQKQRIQLKITTRLRDLGYSAVLDDDNLTITWRIATLSKAL